MRLFSVLAVALFLAAPSDARADPFKVLPDGSVVFNSEFSTAGRFRCGPAAFLPVPCLELVDGGVTLGSGADTLTVSFTGVNSAATVGNIPVPVTLGQIETSITGNGLSFSTPPNQNHTLLSFDFSMTQSSPEASGPLGFTWGFGPGNGAVLPLINGPLNYLSFPTGPNPPGLSYTGIVYTVPRFNLPGFNSTIGVNAQAGVVPEPATLLLVGSGLVGAAYTRRRKQRA